MHGIYVVYTMVYTWYIPTINLVRVPDVRPSRHGVTVTVTVSLAGIQRH